MPACDCCGRMLGWGQGHQHPTDDAIVCDECQAELVRMVHNGGRET